MCNIPRQADLMFIVLNGETGEIINWGGSHMFDYNGYFYTKDKTLKLFSESKLNFFSSFLLSKKYDPSANELRFKFDEFQFPIIFENQSFELENSRKIQDIRREIFRQKAYYSHAENFLKMINNPLFELTPEMKHEIWENRNLLSCYPEQLVFIFFQKFILFYF